MPGADVAVIGGTGFADFLPNAKRASVRTPYGAPSDKIAIGKIGTLRVAFLNRHGARHQHPPHKIPYRANLWALHELGVTHVLSTTAVGSLQPRFKPGHVLVPFQFVDFTKRRPDSFYDKQAVHVNLDDPYCPRLASLLALSARQHGAAVHEHATIAVVEGPRYETRAEGLFLHAQGWSAVNMTQHPEAALARELAMCYANLSLVTDYAPGVKGHPDVQGVTHALVANLFQQNLPVVRAALRTALDDLARDAERSCRCKNALEGARATENTLHD